MYKCLSCGVDIHDISNDVETSIIKLIYADIVSRVDIIWEHEGVCNDCKIYILRQTADNLEIGNYVLDKDDPDFTIQ